MKRRIPIRKHYRRTMNGRIARVRHHSRKIKVPPNWKNVKYYKNKPYVATGIDKKGRLQYIQNPKFIESQSLKKYRRVERLAKQKKKIINRVLTDVNKDSTEAQVVYTMYKTGFRPGTDRATKAEKQAYGATTLLKKHIKIKPKNKVKFNFTGKKGVEIEKEVKDKKLAEIMKDRLTSKEVFDTNVKNVRSYFDKKTDGKYQLKDLRTLKAFETADKKLEELKKAKETDPKIIKKEVKGAVSEELGNTEAIASKSYIAPKLEQINSMRDKCVGEYESKNEKK